MNHLNINHIKTQKANVVKTRYQNLRKITNFFRVFEFFLFLAVISRVSFQLPLASLLKLSNECIHNLSIFLVSPPFVFILGNVIVIILFINSGQFHSTESNKETPKSHQNSSKMNYNYVEMQEKSEENTMMETIFPTSEHQVMRVFYRSRSEEIKRENFGKKCCGLRRSKTEIKSLKDAEPCMKSGEGEYAEDHTTTTLPRKIPSMWGPGEVQCTQPCPYHREDRETVSKRHAEDHMTTTLLNGIRETVSKRHTEDHMTTTVPNGIQPNWGLGEVQCTKSYPYPREDRETVFKRHAEDHMTSTLPSGIQPMWGLGEVQCTKPNPYPRKDREAASKRHTKDNMSSDEFRRTIEDFIAKQQRLLREEECKYALEE